MGTLANSEDQDEMQGTAEFHWVYSEDPDEMQQARTGRDRNTFIIQNFLPMNPKSTQSAIPYLLYQNAMENSSEYKVLNTYNEV